MERVGIISRNYSLRPLVCRSYNTRRAVLAPGRHKVKRVPTSYKISVRILETIRRASQRRIAKLALLAAAVWLFGPFGYAYDQVDKIMPVLVALFAIGVVVNAVAVAVASRRDLHIGRTRNGVRALRLMWRVQAARAAAA